MASLEVYQIGPKDFFAAFLVQVAGDWAAARQSHDRHW
jgi:hypothetical protein